MWRLCAQNLKPHGASYKWYSLCLKQSSGCSPGRYRSRGVTTCKCFMLLWLFPKHPGLSSSKLWPCLQKGKKQEGDGSKYISSGCYRHTASSWPEASDLSGWRQLPKVLQSQKHGTLGTSEPSALCLGSCLACPLLTSLIHAILGFPASTFQLPWGTYFVDILDVPKRGKTALALYASANTPVQRCPLYKLQSQLNPTLFWG